MPQNGRTHQSPMTEQQAAGATSQDATQQHDFEVQKQVHQQIRNDPDYDDWEYGTEPLPHEAWTAKVSKG
ncbi:MAG: hypothetical protein KXJ50_13360 [Vulcanococcus sp.]|nr:hypothetical protein [Vulcanococcus sp.]MBW0174921.1 hypothetical protein [Vulcanococcus sp.]MBW0182045.1 hypothetical protein [Vulcanococcus sp.]